MGIPHQPHFTDPDKARALLETIRWPRGPVCPHCGSMSSHYALHGETTRAGLWKCKDCREQFSVTVGTILERSKVSLNVWMRAIYLLCSARKAITVLQLHRTLNVTYKTAWYMSARIREAVMKNSRSDSIGVFGGKGKTVDSYGSNLGHFKNKKRTVGR